MRSPARILLAMAGLVAVVAFALIVSREREPVYQGRSLTDWLDQIAPPTKESPQAAEAVRQMGTNALPFLLSRLRAQDSPVKRFVLNLSNKQSLFPLHFRDTEVERERAFEAFRALGATAKPAVPSLKPLLKDGSRHIRSLVTFIFGGMGPAAAEAVPELIAALDVPDVPARVRAMIALTQIHEKPELTIPAFIARLGDPDLGVREMAAIGLRPSPREEVIRLLWKSLGDAKIRPGAIQLLKELDWAGIAKAGLN
jgi:HEAT repeat protein